MLYKNFEQAIDDLFEQIIMIVNHSEYVLFGHSMGALIAYELCNKLIDNGKKKPKHLIGACFATTGKL